MEAAAATTERGGSPPSGVRSPGGRGRRPAAVDRVSVILMSLAAFLVVLALLAWQLRSPAATRSAARPGLVIRRVYETTVVETIRGGGSSGSGSSVSQSVSSSGSASLPAAPVVTRSSAR